MDRNTDQHKVRQDNNGLDLRELFVVLWRYKIVIIVITSIFAIGSVI